MVVNDTKKRLPLSAKQEKSFLDFVKGDKYYSKYYDGFYILFKTGLRISEFCGLTLDDIDFENHRICVYKTLNRTTKYYDDGKNRLEKPESVKQITTPKKKASYRWIPMTDGVETAFRSWEKKQLADKEKNGSS